MNEHRTKSYEDAEFYVTHLNRYTWHTPFITRHAHFVAMETHNN